MNNDTTADPVSWLQGLQKAQSEWMRQWLPWGMPVTPAATAPAPGTARGSGGATGSGATAADLTRGVLAQVEQSLGVSRAIWELLGRSAALADTGQRAAAFSAGVQQLQTEFSKLFAPAAAFATPQGGAAPGGFQWGAAPPGFAGLPPNPMGFGLPFAGLPGIGPAREQQESLERLAALAARVMQAQAQLATQWGQVVGNALRDLGQKLAPQLEGGKLPASLREVYDLWVDTAEKAYAGTAQGNAFTQAQSELANALSQLRIAQRDWLEEWGRAFDLPTRAELNSLHQQVRALKEAVQKLTGRV
jgi:hypothetical protein